MIETKAQPGMIERTELVRYLDEYLHVNDIKDYPGAWNGLQVEGRSNIRRIMAAVDGSVATAEEAERRGVDLLLIHHGLFWNPDRQLVGRHLRKIAPLIKGNISVYSCHLPLDAHPQVGNNALLLRQMQLEPSGSFGDSHGTLIGRYADTMLHRDEALHRLESATGSPARNSFFYGPEICRRVGVITGGAGSLIGEAQAAGVDLFITGEGSHDTYFDARELEMNVIYGGHYATETFGVRALAHHLHEKFGIMWEFFDAPSGL